MRVRHRTVHVFVFVWSAVLYAPFVMAMQGGNPDAGKAKSTTCAACHGTDGNGGADRSVPKLAGQVPEYIVEQLAEFKAGKRKNPVMMGMAAPLTEQDMKDLAAYYSDQKPKPGGAASEALARQGERLYRGGNAKTGVPACMSCHGPSGHGIPSRFPRVSGQSAAYSERQLLDFKAGRRTDDDDTMTRIAFRMYESEIKAVSEYMAGLH